MEIDPFALFTEKDLDEMKNESLVHMLISLNRLAARASYAIEKRARQHLADQLLHEVIKRLNKKSKN